MGPVGAHHEVVLEDHEVDHEVGAHHCSSSIRERLFHFEFLVAVDGYACMLLAIARMRVILPRWLVLRNQFCSARLFSGAHLGALIGQQRMGATLASEGERELAQFS